MLIYIIIIVAGIIFDQITKFWAKNILSGMTTYSIIPNVLHFTYVENTGAAFNIFSDKQLFLIIITLVFIVLLGYLFYLLPKTKNYNLANLALALMLSGAIGNLIDRIFLSYVIDFIDFRIIHFAVFNVADSLVVIGALLLLYSYLKNQLILPNKKPVELSPEQEDNSEIVEEKKTSPIRKDVLKDLKPKRKRNTPKIVVQTEIIKLRSTPVPTYVRFDDSSFNTGISYNFTGASDPTPEPETRKNNRYFDQSDHYYQTIQKARGNGGSPDNSNRFMNTIDSYEADISKQRAKAPVKTGINSEWNPQINNNRKVKTYDYNWNPEYSTDLSSRSKRFEKQLSEYEESVERIENEDSGDNETHNRYQESTDSYIESIKKIRNKNILNNEGTD